MASPTRPASTSFCIPIRQKRQGAYLQYTDQEEPGFHSKHLIEDSASFIDVTGH